MCRLLIANKASIKAYDAAQCGGLGKLLAHLEKECGGHGNGIATIDHKGKLQQCAKGVNMSIDEVLEIALNTSNYEYMIFHTRIASVGQIEDERCHPFTFGNDVLAMNGTLSSLSRPARAIGITDTELAFDLVKGRAFTDVIALLQTLNAVFVGVTDDGQGKPYAIKNGGDLEEWVDGATECYDFMFASSFPCKTAGVRRLPYDFVFADGERQGTVEPMGPTRRRDEKALASTFMTDREYIGVAGYGASFWGSDDDDGEDDLYMEYNEGYREGYAAGFMDGQGTATNPCA